MAGLAHPTQTPGCTGTAGHYTPPATTSQECTSSHSATPKLAMRGTQRPQPANLEAAIMSLRRLKESQTRRRDAAALPLPSQRSSGVGQTSAPSAHAAMSSPQTEAKTPPRDTACQSLRLLAAQRPLIGPPDANELRAAVAATGSGKSDAVATLRRVASRCSMAPLATEAGSDGEARNSSGIDVLDVLRTLPELPDLRSANAAMSACRRRGDAVAAWDVYARMHRHNIWPDADTAGSLIPVLADSGEWERSVLVYTRMLRSRIHVNGAACMAMLRALQLVGRWRVAEAALLCALPVSPFTTVADTLADLGESEEAGASEPTASELLNLSRRSIAPLVATPDSEASNSLNTQRHSAPDDTRTPGKASTGSGRALADADGSAEDAADQPWPRRPEGRHDDTEPFAAFALSSRAPLYLLSSPIATECCNIVLEMYRDASPPQANRARTLISAMAEAADAKSFFQLPAPDQTSIATAVEAHCTLGDPREAWSLLRVLAEVRAQPGAAALEALVVTACRAQDDRDPAMRLWQAFKFQGALPDGVCCATLLIAAAHAADGDAGVLKRCVQRLGGEWASTAFHIAPHTLARISADARAILSAVTATARCSTPAHEAHRALLAAGVAISGQTVLSCCEHAAPLCKSDPHRRRNV